VSPGKRKAPEGTGTDANTRHHQPESYTSHETYMRQFGRRIAWLSDRRHWWLRTPEGRSQLEFLERRDAA
jgi:hypothetical protein